MKRSNKLIQALNLPTVMNVNPRSIYNKKDEFHAFVEEELVDCVFMSESWERPDMPLDQIIDLPNHVVISNPHQRKGVGGRPALIINNAKYHVKNLTQSLIEIPWGVEATWAIIAPKNLSSDSLIKKIAVCSVYCKPKSRKKTLLLDHINQAFNVISTKYGSGLHFIISGDTNDLKLDNIINLSPTMRQLVTGITRLDPPAMLDPIISTLGMFYQPPVCLPPLDPDPDSNGSPSDHLIVIMRPLDTINNRPNRTIREVKVRPLPASGLGRFGSWIEQEDWTEVLSVQNVDTKAENLHKMVLSKLDEFCPEKLRKIASDDQPWFTEQLKRLDRKRRRQFRKNRRSKKYKKLQKAYKIKLLESKRKFKKNMIDDVMVARDGQWYSKLKRIANYDQTKNEKIQVDEISHLTDKEQAEAIADSFSAISSEYEPVNRDEIEIPLFTKASIPNVKPWQVRRHLQTIKTNKSTAPGDIPAKVIKQFAAFLCVPVADIINRCLSSGHWPKYYKKETITPTPKQYPPESREFLRPIANLFNFNKTMEKIVAELVISDMKSKLDPAQFGNQKHTSIQHYLVRLLHRVLTNVDRNCKGEVNAVLCLFIDWKQAYSRQCHTLGVKSFINNGVRASLIPLLISYFEDREMRVRWHGEMSETRKLPGGGAMGATLGNWEFLSQTNNNADCVPEDDRFKFVDDLTTLEVISLLTIGLSSFNFKQQVASDIPTHGQFITKDNLKSQDYLDNINSWTEQQKMIINQKKTKAMIFNFTNNHQFTTRLSLKGENIEVVNQMKILGTIINNSLSWDENCSNLIKKVNSRMQLLRNIYTFGASNHEMVHLWILYCRSVLEQSCVLWHNSLTLENIEDLERTQKSFAKLVLRERYVSYENALQKLNLETLEERRSGLCLKFAKAGIKHKKMDDLFPQNPKKHKMNIRETEMYKVEFANTKRLQTSSIPMMQNYLNYDANQTKKRKCGS